MSTTTAPETPQAASQTGNWFANAPAGDVSFDDLFPPESPMPPETPATPEPGTAPQTPPAAPQEDFFLKASNSVYKTPEDAIKGIEEKDSLIGQLRAKYIEQTGTDPITGRTVRPTAPPSQAQPPEDVSYYRTPEKYFDDLVKAVESKQPEKYLAAQQRLILETLAPYAPAIQGFARQQAIEQVATEIKDVREFIGSPAYQKALETLPVLGNAIQQAEQRPEFQGQLPQLYRTAYLVSQGMNLPELIKAQAPSPAPAVPPARPTMGAATLTPPTQPAAPEDMGSSAGRKAIIERLGPRVANHIW